MSKKNASTLIYLIFLFSVILAFCAMAIDATIIYTTRMKLQDATEKAAMAGAGEFSKTTISIPEQTHIEQAAKSKARNTFKHFLFGALNQNNTKIDSVEAKYSSRKILINSSVSSPTFFLAFLGVQSVKVKAKVCAVSEKLDVKNNTTPTIMWITLKALYYSSVINHPQDTSIAGPLGQVISANPEAKFNLITNLDGHPLSLGPGGYLTVKLPVPLVNKPGYDLFIEEAGDALEGYFVFAGLDVDSAEHYLNQSSPGFGIQWKNITCSAVGERPKLGPYTVDTPPTGNQKKIYGSAYFDLGDDCVNLSLVKYIKIVDDNSESAFVFNQDTDSYYKTMLYGEASTATAGADIDAIQVLNFVKLIPPPQHL